MKKLTSAFNRAKTNHPFKTFSGGILATGSGATVTSALLLAPFDMGISAIVLGCITGGGTIISTIATGIHNSDYSHKKIKTISHQGKTYRVTEAQAKKYESLKSDIRSLEQDYKIAVSDNLRKKIQKKAQKLVNYQEDILDSKNVRLEGQNPEAKPMTLTYRQRGQGN